MQYHQRPQFRHGFNGSLITPAVRWLIFADGIIFIVQKTFGSQVIDWFGLHPAYIVQKFSIWQFFSYMFLHGDWLHILFNMFMLWMFGCEVERHWGKKEFFKYYSICGIGAGFFHLIFNFTSSVPVVGASGAVYGILIAFAMLFPERPIILFPFFMVLKAKYWALIFAGLALLFGLFDRQNGVAHFAHLGGMIIGFLYLKLGWKISLFKLDYFKRRKMEWDLKQTLKKRQRIMKLRQEVDLILDKINEIGFNNLSEKEKRILKEASNTLSTENDTL